MACPGGCIGGGGQPVPADAAIRRSRAESLYNIDRKKEVRSAQENPIVQKVYREFLNSPKLFIKFVIQNILKRKEKSILKIILKNKSYDSN